MRDFLMKALDIFQGKKYREIRQPWKRECIISLSSSVTDSQFVCCAWNGWPGPLSSRMDVRNGALTMPGRSGSGMGSILGEISRRFRNCFETLWKKLSLNYL